MSDQVLDADALEQAKLLVKHLESGDTDGAVKIIDILTQTREDNLFREVGKLTRDLHEALTNFQLDSRIPDLAAQDIPDAKERLEHVISMTDQAANRTMDAVETCIPLADAVAQESSNLHDEWRRLMRKELEPGEFRQLCIKMDSFLKETSVNSSQLQSLLTEVLMAQDYQDLTGQIIKRVITLVHDVEESLVNTIKMFGAIGDYEKAVNTEVEHDPNELEGPIVNKEGREDVVSGQDDVDDLSSSLGF